VITVNKGIVIPDVLNTDPGAGDPETTMTHLIPEKTDCGMRSFKTYF
jgi:hypothetical protein